MDRNTYLTQRLHCENRLEQSRMALSRELIEKREKWGWLVSLFNLVPKKLPWALAAFVATRIFKKFSGPH